MFEDIRQSADMVLVSVSKNNAFELLFVFEQITHVGDDQVDTQKIRARKHETAIDGNRCTATLKEHHVKAKLSKAAQRYDF